MINAHNAAGTATTERSVAALITLRMQREIDLKAIFAALNLEYGTDTVDDAVAMIQELIETFSKYESLCK
ncbi:hypothetical protein [Methylobacterium sp. Leaf466]|uniref:hypothetical protein n=1 Tax=Methylobacterium sp. Leaf466 TaxID=1736386 RepID=UPI0006FC6323|nr:hypothetical protein [Methylobacterium sp. Leaf466]KQT82412.1 hypothetical protein ASG59_18645 [Methylobacterium sp. Leaf466]